MWVRFIVEDIARALEIYSEGAEDIDMEMEDIYIDTLSYVKGADSGSKKVVLDTTRTLADLDESKVKWSKMSIRWMIE